MSGIEHDPDSSLEKQIEQRLREEVLRALATEDLTQVLRAITPDLSLESKQRLLELLRAVEVAPEARPPGELRTMAFPVRADAALAESGALESEPSVPGSQVRGSEPERASLGYSVQASDQDLRQLLNHFEVEYGVSTQAFEAYITSTGTFGTAATLMARDQIHDILVAPRPVPFVSDQGGVRMRIKVPENLASADIAPEVVVRLIEEMGNGAVEHILRARMSVEDGSGRVLSVYLDELQIPQGDHYQCRGDTFMHPLSGAMLTNIVMKLK